MVYLCTNFHLHSSNSSLVISIKPKTKENIRGGVMLFYTVKNITLTKAAYFYNY
jgi:hypothetical protein